MRGDYGDNNKWSLSLRRQESTIFLASPISPYVLFLHTIHPDLSNELLVQDTRTRLRRAREPASRGKPHNAFLSGLATRKFSREPPLVHHQDPVAHAQDLGKLA